MLVGYARVSSVDQKLEVQLDQLKEAGCDKIFCEKISGKSADNRVEFQKALAFAREGDVFVVTRLDRASRSMSDLVKLILELQKKGVQFKCLLQAGVDTTTAEGRLMLNLLGSFAEFEREIRAARQAEGIAKARAKGKYKRVKWDPVAVEAKIREMRAENMGATEIIAALALEGIKVSKPKLYRLTPGIWAQEMEHVRLAREKRQAAEVEF